MPLEIIPRVPDLFVEKDVLVGNEVRERKRERKNHKRPI